MFGSFHCPQTVELRVVLAAPLHMPQTNHVSDNILKQIQIIGVAPTNLSRSEYNAWPDPLLNIGSKLLLGSRQKCGVQDSVGVHNSKTLALEPDESAELVFHLLWRFWALSHSDRFPLEVDPVGPVTVVYLIKYGAGPDLKSHTFLSVQAHKLRQNCPTSAVLIKNESRLCYCIAYFSPQVLEVWGRNTIYAISATYWLVFPSAQNQLADILYAKLAHVDTLINCVM